MLGYVRIYTPRAKEQIRSILENHLTKFSIPHYTDNILTCVDELVKNAVKANYKFVILREQIENYLSNGGGSDSLEEILRDRDLYNKYAREVLTPEITKKVRKALTQESKVISLKTKAYKEKRRYSDEERAEILGFNELIEIQKKVRQYGAKVQLRVNEIFNALNIEVMNNAPILNTDLDRIHQKRHEFADYCERGEEMMFFIENMDEADGGAGLGYATIDAGLREMNVDPFETINIISVTNTTVIIYFKNSTLEALA